MSSSDTSAQRSQCPISCTLDILGDRWTLLVVRDLLMGKKRYAEFAESPEGIPTNLLADRLKRLEKADIVSRHQYGSHARRFEYQLTDKGHELKSVIVPMVQWGLKHVENTDIPAIIRKSFDS